jgi:hypothetical protein
VNGDHAGPFQIAVSVHQARILATAGLPPDAGYDAAFAAAMRQEINVAVAAQLYADYGSWHHWRFSASCHGAWP